MSRYRNELAGRREAARALWVAVGVSTLLALVMGAGWMSAPSRLRIHIPPDLSSGAVVAADSPAAPNVYTFGWYLWQQLNRWPEDGAADYRDRVMAYSPYLTPACRQDRLKDHEARLARGELSGRQRAVWEIPGRGYAYERVRAEGAGSWVVYLDVQIEETINGQRVKARAVSYALRIVRYDVDPTLNPFGLALDCLAAVPGAIGVEGAAG